MPCDSVVIEPRQTLNERKDQIKKTVEQLAKDIASGKIKPVVGKQGGIAFAGWTDDQRNRITDACAYRRIMAGDSTAAKVAIAKAEQVAGVSVNKKALASGLHAHDDGRGNLAWYPGHKG